MKAPEDHAKFIGGFDPGCERPASWDGHSWERLLKFGRWYEALVTGAIQPVSDGQRRFIELFRSEVEREPANSDEHIWDAFQRLRRYELAPKQHKSGMSLRVAKDSNAPPRLPNGDDDAVYFVRRRRK